MNLQIPLRRGRLAVPLALAILAGPLLTAGADSMPLAWRGTGTARLGCAVSAAIGVERVHVLQLPGDLPLHLRVRLRGCSQTT
jgi:hypothetical protein